MQPLTPLCCCCCCFVAVDVMSSSSYVDEKIWKKFEWGEREERRKRIFFDKREKRKTGFSCHKTRCLPARWKLEISTKKVGMVAGSGSDPANGKVSCFICKFTLKTISWALQMYQKRFLFFLRAQRITVDGKGEVEMYYFNFSTGESSWDHPCDKHYKLLYEKEKKKKTLLIHNNSVSETENH